MNTLGDIITKYREERENKNEQKTISERHEIVSKFSDKINGNRVRDGLKPLNNAFLNRKMADAGLRTNFDLYWFFKYCDETKNFDKTWWWSLKTKEPPQRGLF